MDIPEDQFEMRTIVKGFVQGVGFRATTRYFAKQLGLNGTVRNLPDGTVEILAQGPKLKLEELLRVLAKEMGPGRIEETIIDYFPISQPCQGFLIIS